MVELKEIAVTEVWIDWGRGKSDYVVVTPERTGLPWEENISRMLREAKQSGAIKNFKVKYGVMPVPVSYETFEDEFRRAAGL